MIMSIPTFKILQKLSEFKLKKVLAHPHDKIYEVVNDNIEIHNMVGKWRGKIGTTTPAQNDLLSAP